MSAPCYVLNSTSHILERPVYAKPLIRHMNNE